jgi:hypothetical protein
MGVTSFILHFPLIFYSHRRMEVFGRDDKMVLHLHWEGVLTEEIVRVVTVNPSFGRVGPLPHLGQKVHE